MNKPFRIAVLADLHLPDVKESAQAAVWEWALTTVREDPPDLLLVAGDMTAMGTAAGATRVRDAVESLGIPYRMVPGNADVRTATDREASCRLLTAATVYQQERVLVVSLAAPEGHYSPEEQRAVSAAIAAADGREVVVLAHYTRGAAHDDWLQPLVRSGAVSLHIAGHSHADSVRQDGAGVWHVVRGLDPDKVQGPSPAIALFTLRDDGWERAEIGFTGCDPATWTQAERDEFRERLGFSCMTVTLEALALARAEAVRCVELRAQPALAVDQPALAAAVAAWRDSGGTTLSLHMPELFWKDGAIQGTVTWQATLALALELGAQSLTIHPPRASVAAMQAGGEAWCSMRDFMVDSLRPAVAAGMTWSIENLHTVAGAPADDSRHYGCLPEETLAWIAGLRAACPDAVIGHHFDNGHARNNPPFHSPYPIATWLAAIGHEISGYHLHQVGMSEGRMINHIPVTQAYGGVIAYHSLFWAWHQRQVQRAPMYIEVRGGLDSIRTSLHTLRSHLDAQ